jgi:hypothetical protein
MRAGTPIPLAIGQRADIVIRLARGAVISGVLLDHDNQPAAGALVRALRYQMANGERRLVSVGDASTDDRGVYRIYGLAAGDYYVAASARGLGGVSAGEVRLTSDVDVREASRPTAAPPPMKTVAFAPAYFPHATSVSQASVVSLRPGEERDGVDFALQLVPTARVEGSVTLPDGGVPAGAELNLIAVGATATPGLPFEGYRPGRPASDGTFAFPGVPPGQYTLLARATRPIANPDGSPAAAQMVWASTQIAVDGEPVTGLSMSLEPGLTISGRVRFPVPASIAQPDLRSVRLAALPADTESSVSFTPPAVSAASDGRFTIAGLLPGRYRLSATFPGMGRPGGWVVQSIIADAQDALDAPIVLRPNQHLLDALVTFTDRLSQVSGVVVTAAAPAPDYIVVLFPEDQRLWLPQTRRIQAARAATDGSYTFRGMPSGRYLLALTNDAEPGEWFDPQFLQRLLASAMRVVIGDGDRKTQNLRAVPER